MPHVTRIRDLEASSAAGCGFCLLLYSATLFDDNKYAISHGSEKTCMHSESLVDQTAYKFGSGGEVLTEEEVKNLPMRLGAENEDWKYVEKLKVISAIQISAHNYDLGSVGLYESITKSDVLYSCGLCQGLHRH